MNLVCFPHYTCGGLLCDILQNTFSPIGGSGGIDSITHKIGKIGDSDSVFADFDSKLFYDALKSFDPIQNSWIGTHCWPGSLDVSMFDQVLIVTTTTFRSKLYRWIRAYYHYYSKSQPWVEAHGQARIDKEKETAKNYLKPFLPVAGKNIVNIEFAEVVEVSKEFQHIVHDYNYDLHIKRWKKLNDFLYDSAIWNSDAVKRFYEAELETNLSCHYRYE